MSEPKTVDKIAREILRIASTSLYLVGTEGQTLQVNEDGCVERIAEVLSAERERAEELQRIFDLNWEADMRAVKRWRAEKPGRDLTLPDRADLVVWLLEKLEATERKNRNDETG